MALVEVGDLINYLNDPMTLVGVGDLISSVEIRVGVEDLINYVIFCTFVDLVIVEDWKIPAVIHHSSLGRHPYSLGRHPGRPHRRKGLAT